MYISRSRKTLFCLECGHSWKEQSSLITAVACTCPSCGKDLKLKAQYCKVYRDSEYYAVLTTKCGFQVIRMFYVTKFLEKLKQPSFGIHEVMQHWISPDGKNTLMSKSVQGLSRYYDQWIIDSELQVRPGSEKSNMRYALEPYKIYPERRILPIIKRNGFKGYFHDLSPQRFFTFILKDPMAETLLKLGQFSLFTQLAKYPDKIKENWASVKICLRNRYIIKDASIWLDYISLLVHFGKDLRSPKYVCPDNLLLAHDKLVYKKRDQDKKIKLEKLRAKIEKANVKYAKQKSMFFDLLFSDGDIEIRPLATVEEFMKEGDELGHCVFASEYYTKQKSLIMSARIQDKPIETIEVDLNRLEVVQSRGIRNKATEYHNRILHLVGSNMNLIQQLV